MPFTLQDRERPQDPFDLRTLRVLVPIQYDTEPVCSGIFMGLRESQDGVWCGFKGLFGVYRKVAE